MTFIINKILKKHAIIHLIEFLLISRYSLSLSFSIITKLFYLKRNIRTNKKTTTRTKKMKILYKVYREAECSNSISIVYCSSYTCIRIAPCRTLIRIQVKVYR